MPASPTHKGRYAPWLKKALARMEHSKAIWCKQEAPPVIEVTKSPKTKRRGQIFDSIWDATRAGDVTEVKRFLETSKINVFAHNEAEGGRTLLHIACWNGHVKLVMYLTMFIQAAHGLDTLKRSVNAIDTTYSRCTPLLEVCRSRKGDINDKIKILKLLIQFGAVVEHQDAHGDNALHWSVRMHSLPIVRFLINDTDAAVFASISDNLKRQKPIDIAKVAMELKPSMNTVEIYDTLRRISKECNIRLKIQYGKKIRLQEEVASRAERSEFISHAVASARVLSSQVEKIWLSTHSMAESVRNNLETSALNHSGNEAVGKAQLWLETKDGKTWIKDNLQDELDQVKSLIQRGVIPKPRDLKKAAAVRLSDKYVADQEATAREIMRKKFSRDHPALDSRELEYYKRLVGSGLTP
ncbi:hypothetical protein AeMF1_013442 [Aphanomyces euteiches]|nr:hypothetical protein AeMF1_013442 [Aphanomyces euteiches]KAH9193722.1 hypothetical protein AeNC1_004302 [Aphanomyces euteiches]